LPAAYGIAPRVRIGRDKWLNLLWLIPLGFVALIIAVAVAQGLRNMLSVRDFIARHPGTSSLLGPLRGCRGGSQHFLKVLFMIFIIRAGLQILAGTHLPGGWGGCG